MLDREKVIEILESCVANPLHRKGDKFVISFDVRFVNAIIELLKEQPELVRCKDCKHHGKDTCSAAAGIAYPPPDEWYCADGERRTDDA